MIPPTPISRRAFLATAGLGLAAGALALAGCGTQAAATPTPSSPDANGLKKVRIAVSGQDGTLQESALIAQHQHFIEDELQKVGYAPEYLGFAQAGPAINEAFVSGSIDVAEYGDLPIYSAISKGVAIKAFASSSTASQYGIFVRNDAGVSSVTDLKGKRVVTGFGTIRERYLEDELKKVGLTAQDLELVNAAADGPAMIDTGQADAISAALPQIFASVNQDNGHLVASTNDDQSLAPTVLFAHRADYAEQNPDVAPALVRALKRAWDFAQANRDQALENLVTASVTRDVAAKVYPTSDFSFFDPHITDELKTKIEGLGQFMLDAKLVTRDVPIEEFFDEGPIRSAGI